MVNDCLQQTKFSLCGRCYVSLVIGICPIKICASKERYIELLKTDVQMRNVQSGWKSKPEQSPKHVCIYNILGFSSLGCSSNCDAATASFLPPRKEEKWGSWRQDLKATSKGTVK